MDTTTVVWIVAIAGAVAILVIAVSAVRTARARSDSLRRRFGPEYDRAVERHGNVLSAERELATRQKRIARLHIHELDDPNRTRFAATWTAIQGRFVDDPLQAVRDANELIKDALLMMGYPAAEFEQRTADLSVDHADIVLHYRAAHDLANANIRGKVDTEQLRQAMVHYRALFSELIERPPSPRLAQLGPAHV